MSEQSQNTEDEVRTLLERVKTADDTTQELAFDLLRKFADDCGIILDWQRRDGRQLVLLGADPEEIKTRTLERVDEARGRLHASLVKLLAWSKGAGRMG